jgi:hypothetical protein
MKTIVSPYALAGVKSFRGMEGYGLNATLTRDGQKVAFILDEGNGGCVRFDFRNPGQSPKTIVDRAVAEQQEADFAGYCREWYRDCGLEQHDREESDRMNAGQENPTPFIPSASYMMEMWVARHADQIETKRRLDRLAKKKTLFRLVGQNYDDGAWLTITAPYDAKVQAYLDKKYPGKVAEIYGIARLQVAA